MSNPQGLAKQILPARGAAQKASASFANQLADSSGHSDGDSPSSSSLFREPAHRTKAVKYRYSATGKHLSSPLKGSPSSPDRKQDKSRYKRMATSPSHVPKSEALAVASTSRKRKASESASPSRKEKLQRSIFLSSPSPLSSVPTTPVVSKQDLPPSPSLTVKELTPDPPKRPLIANTLSLRSIRHTPSKFSVVSRPLSPKRKQKKKKTNAKKDNDVWAVGNSVWVLVNQSGVFADKDTSLGSSGQLMWWPAQVVQGGPLRVSLFGDFPSPSSTGRGLCTIFAPSPSNILSINDDSGAKRFSRATFLPRLSPDDDVSPPAKKPRLDETPSIEARWESAVQSMDKASTLAQDGLPALLSSYATTGNDFCDESDSDTSDLRQSLRNPNNSTQGESKLTESTKKSKPARSKLDTNESITRALSLCPPDPTLQIPGEFVLALAPRTGSSYWPAQILEHVPGRKEQYRVKFLDDKEYVIARDRFWTSEEEGFVQCTLGEWESAVKTTDDLDSGDEDGNWAANTNADTTGFDDPACALPPPPLAKDFEDLSVRAQLAYVKPVLQAILTKEYAPAQERHDAFMRGGSARVELLKSAGVRGGMDARFVKAVQKAICEWVLGDVGLKPERLDIANDVTKTTESEGVATTTASSGVLPGVTLPRASTEDDKMEGIESAVPEVLQIAKSDATQNIALPLSPPDEHVDGAQNSAGNRQEEQRMSLPPTNGVALSPLAAKSQLDLLAEVSQAVATEPSLLPFHPEVPRLKVDPQPKDMSGEPSPLTPIADEAQRVPPQKRGPTICEEFYLLSGIEKLDYCLNVLLPETIQQLLLWRSGERTSSALLSPEEEQGLHDVAARKATETDWVDDLMRLRAAQARLRGVDINKKAKKAEVIRGGTRLRPRLSRP